MNKAFNLIDEPFIPCIRPGGRREELGLRRTLAEAHEIREIRDDSPLVTISLHRLLLAILHRNFGPESLDAWKSLWDAGRFDTEVLGRYFETWRERFFLCHPERPFYQAPDVASEKEVSVWRLDLVQANNATLFDHRTEHEVPAISAAEAAKALISYQTFAIGGGISKPFNFMHSPVAREKGYLVLVLGGTLFETLCLNAMPYTSSSPIPSSADDRPVWERQEQREPKKAGTPIEGYLDYLTWQSRRILLRTDNVPDVRFSRMRMLQGLAIPAEVEAVEPMAAYVRVRDGSHRAKGIQEGRGLWRDSHILLGSGADDSRPPLAILFLEELKARGILDQQNQYRCAAFGICSDRAKLSLWRHETMPLPLTYLGNRELLDDLRAGLMDAEAAAAALRAAVRRLAELSLQSARGGRPDKDRVNQLTDSLRGDVRYWPQLEHPFRSFLVGLAAQETSDKREDCLQRWTDLVCRIARGVFDQIVHSLDFDPRVLRAVYQDFGRSWSAAKVLNVELAKLTKNLCQTTEGAAHGATDNDV